MEKKHDILNEYAQPINKAYTIFVLFHINFIKFFVSVHLFVPLLTCTFSEVNQFEAKLVFKEICSNNLLNLGSMKLDHERKYEMKIENPGLSEITISEFKMIYLNQVHPEIFDIKTNGIRVLSEKDHFIIKPKEAFFIFLNIFSKNEVNLEGAFTFRTLLDVYLN